MGAYLKDVSIPYLTIQENDLDALNTDLTTIMNEVLSTDSSIHIEYILRYDGMGIIRKDYNEIKQCFEIAKKIDRVILNLKNKETYLAKGKEIEIRLDSSNYNNCYLKVADDDSAWVEKNFKLLSSRLDKFKNKNFIVHSDSVTLAIQLLGVLSGLFVSLIAAKLLTPFVNIQYSFFILFISIYLVFSNLWTFILYNINKIKFAIWPLISFNKKPLGIIGQAVIALVVSSVVVFLARWSFNIIKDAGQLIAK